MVPPWKEYQEEVAEFFRQFGLEAETDITLDGARTRHDIDVVVTSSFMGIPITWLIECKSWRTRVPKERVFALRQIVDDLGADRGFLMNENGYQKGALEAAVYSNVHLTTLADLRETCRYDIELSKLRRIHQQVQLLRERYWALSKSDRVKYELRGDVGEVNYSGARVIDTAESCVVSALLIGFPVIYDEFLATLHLTSGPDFEPRDGSIIFNEPGALVAHLADELSELERRLTKAESLIVSSRHVETD